MTVKRREFAIAVGGQKAEGFFYCGEADAPGLLLYTDIKGVRAVYHEQAERLATEGFAVLMPNVFFRESRLPVWAFPFQPGEARTMKRIDELKAALTPDQQLADGGEYVDCLRKLPGVKAGPVGVVGYCYTGGMALRTAASRP